ncbi:MAG: 16S rRNA (adenine(1518)-N(6)/adenine(1519)-N(6))-dimethyltransferase RsmA [Verrucomicrobiota bacterium]
MNLSSLQSTLTQVGIHPSRALGQNFLHDQNTAEWMVAQLSLKPNEAWIELGPGLGSLTQFTVLRSENGLLIEKDDRVIEFLRSQYPTLEIFHGDALTFDMRTLAGRAPLKVLGNLPYNVSSQILFQFTTPPSPASLLVFTLQKDLGERLCASPRTKAYGALTLLIGRQWRVKYLKTLPGSVFFPKPNVESAVVSLTPRPPGELPDCDSARFRRLVKIGFSQRRKLLRNNLADCDLNWSELCAHLAVPETIRAEELSLAQWIALTNFPS